MAYQQIGASMYALYRFLYDNVNV